MKRRNGVPFFFIAFLKQYQAVASNNGHGSLLRHRHLEGPQCHHSALYHTHMTLKSTCTNDNVYPPPWDQPPMSERFFMATAQECCSFYFNDEPCDIINVCGDQTAPPHASSAPSARPTARPTRLPGEIPTLHQNDGCHPNRKWHADTTLGKNDAGCTNNDVYPPGWDKPPMVDSMFFDDASSCCAYFFMGREDCEWVDVCAAIDAASGTASTVAVTSSSSAVSTTTTTTTTSSSSSSRQEEQSAYTYPSDNPCHLRKWHPDTSHLDNICTNNLNYPQAWDNGIMSGVTMFQTPEACCEKLIKTNGGQCDIVEDSVCIDKTETTSHPTLGPTKMTTASPTKHPIAVDDSGDGSVYECSDKWHPDEEFTGCTNAGEGSYPPQWDQPDMAARYMFDDYAPCCDTFFEGKDCIKTDLCEEVVEEAEDCSILKWHPSSDFKHCTNSQDYPSDWNHPSAAGKFIFDTYEECCSAHHAEKHCPKVDVCNADACNDNLWHPTSDFTKCSNNLDYPSSWNYQPGLDKYMVASYDECCSSFFAGQPCPKDDICNPPTCEENKWHPTNSFKKCSNTLDHPSDWTTDNYLYDSYEECCSKMFIGQYCPKEDVCNPTTCKDQFWHPSSKFDKCTNSLDFPSSWTTDNYLHLTSAECCSAIFPGRTCPKEDVCSDGEDKEEIPCEDQAWHPTMDFKFCTNDLDYPPGWNEPPGRDNYMHESYDACCAAIFFGRECPRQDVCDPSSSTTLSPTTHAPTKQPSVETRSPTKMPQDSLSHGTTVMPSLSPNTDMPTLFPTSTSPTSSPIECIPAKWHPGSEGSCSNSPEYNILWDVPSLSKIYLHDTHASCCRQFYDKKNCGKEDFCGDKSTVIPTPAPSQKPSSFSTQKALDDTNICKLKKYHPISVFDRKCTNNSSFPPLWNDMTSTYFFTTAQECCDSFYRDGSGSCETVDVCLDADRKRENVQDCGKKWHPTSETYRICSNGDQYPPVWESMAEQFFFDNAEDCCKTFYSGGTGQCDVFNTC